MNYFWRQKAVVESVLACQPSSCIAPLRDTNRLVELLVELTGKPANEVVGRLKGEYLDMGSSVKKALLESGIKPFEWSGRLQDFYARTDSFLYETIVWNLAFAKCDLRSWIVNYLQTTGAGKSVLTFGDGPGFDSWYLAAAGFDVTYHEVSRQCSDFARLIFEESRLDVDVSTDLSNLDGRKFDSVVCLDVLEHVPDPPGLVLWLSERLKPGGRLFVNAPFYLLNARVQTHLRCNRKFSGDFRRLYSPAGLVPVAGRMFWNPIVLKKGNSGRIPVTVRVGQILLMPGRFWATPYTVVSNAMVQKKHPLNLE